MTTNTVEPPETRSRFRDFFELEKRGSTMGREVRGGVATFFTMCYIIVLNPIILVSAPVVDGYKPSFLAVSCVTALVAGLMTIIMGVVGKYPFAIAAGLGINAIIAFQMAPVIGYEGAMGVVVLEGILTTILVLTGVRTALFHAIPLALKQAIGIGIGLFLAFIGLVDGGLVKGAAGAPPVSLGTGGSIATWPNVVFIFTLFLTAILLTRKVPGAIIISIVSGTILAVIIEAVQGLGSVVDNPSGWALNVPSWEGKDVVTTPDFSVLGHFSIPNVFGAGVLLGVVFVFSLVLADLFDTMGTIVGVGGEAKLLDAHGNLPGVGRVLGVDSVAAVAGGAAGVSSNTTYVESAAGVAEGARTGIASLVTGALFLVSIFISPLAAIVPSEAAAPVLVVVGFLMFGQIAGISWNDPDTRELTIAAFLGIVVMPFTFSITNGIGAAFITYVVLMVAKGKARQVHAFMWVLASVFAVYFALIPLRELFGI